MATLSVLNYNNLPSGLNMKVNNQNSSSTGAINTTPMSKTFNKITVQNVLSENNSNSLNITNGIPNAIVRKIKDFGMIGSVNNASGAATLSINPRKRSLAENKPNQKPAESKLTPPASKKPKLTKEERAAIRLAKKAAKENSNLMKADNNGHPLELLQKTKVPGTPGRKGLPLPQAVARRNARERNRVKQVNNGFAALREHIPEEVAEVFETQSTNSGNRGSCKKFSKVDTLRMAVEYIRSLERLLGFDFPVAAGQHNSSSGEEGFSLIKDEFNAYSPNTDEHFDDSLSHYDNEEFFSANNSLQQTQLPLTSPQTTQHIDMLPNITTLNGLQYIRIPGTNTYQLLTPDIFVGTASSPPSSTIDEEHFNALIDTNCISPSSSTTSGIMQQEQQQQPTTTSDQQSPSPPSINSTEVIRRVPETAPVLTTATNGENINNEGTAVTLLSSSSSSSTSSSSLLLLSPVPQNQQQQIIPLLTATSSPSTSPVLHQHTQQLHTLSPATTNDQHHQQQLQLQQGLRQTCAANQLQQQQFLLPNSTDQQIGTLHMIKQEHEEPSSNIYQQTSPSQQQQQQHHLQLYHSAMSPSLERQTPTTSTSASTSNSSSHMLQQFFSHEQNSNSFYEGIVTMKKELNAVLLDASHATNVMSDESMIEAIDWWDAHTPKSDGGSLMM